MVDASVIASALFQEPGAEQARALLLGRRDMRAPDLVYAELANVIWKRCLRGEMEAPEAGEMLADCLRLPLQITPCRDLAGPALELALRTGRTAYDCLYLALAVQTGAVLVSSDRRLVNSLSRGPLKRHVAWLGEFR